MHFYDFNIGDYAKKTQHLTNEEDIAYRRALDMYYDTEQPLPITHGLATLARRLRVDIEALKVIVEEFFPDGRNKHCDEVIANYYAFLERQKANGKKGGRPKHKDLKPSGNPVVSQNNPAPSQPLPTTHLPVKKKPLSEYSDEFMSFWKAYPKKEAKQDAWKAWKSERPELQKIIDALAWQITTEQWLKDGGQFIPLPATYLRAGRWQDEKQDPAKVINGKPWYITASGIEAKAREHNINVEGRLVAEYKIEVYKAAGVTPEMVRKANADYAN